VRAAAAQHLAHRQHGVAVGLEVRRDRVDEGLDALRRLEPLEDPELGLGQAELLPAGDALAL
jgi:hypothetical protein